MIRGRRLAICWLTLALLSAGSGWASDDWPVLRNREPSPAPSISLDVQYFQAGCVLIRYGDDYLLTDPLFSNPSLLGILFLDTSRITRVSRPPDIDWSRIRGIVVGHGHYDHILDAPFVLEKVDASTELYGFRTVANLLQPLVPGDRLRAVAGKDELLNSGEIKVGDSPFRFQPILSEHAPLFGNFVFPRGHIDEPPERPQNRACGWKVGQILTYLIDVFSDGVRSAAPRFRIYFQSSASDAPIGFPPEKTLKDKAVDLAIISAAGFDRVKNYPDRLLHHLKPKRVMIVHYEPFWKPMNAQTVETLPRLDMDKFLEQVYRHIEPDRVYLPLATSILTID